MFSYHGLFVIKCILKNGKVVQVTGVAQCNRDVAQVAASLGAGYRCPFEALIEGMGCERQFPGQCVRRAGIFEGWVALKCESIPWADHLTNVTPKNPIPIFFTQFNRDFVL